MGKKKNWDRTILQYVIYAEGKKENKVYEEVNDMLKESNELDYELNYTVSNKYFNGICHFKEQQVDKFAKILNIPKELMFRLNEKGQYDCIPDTKENELLIDEILGRRKAKSIVLDEDEEYDIKLKQLHAEIDMLVNTQWLPEDKIKVIESIEERIKDMINAYVESYLE